MTDVKDLLDKRGFSIVTKTLLKKGSRKFSIAEASANLAKDMIVEDISLQALRQYVEEQAQRQEAEALDLSASSSAYSLTDLLQDCKDIYDMYRWYVEEGDTIKTFYKKDLADVEQYTFICTVGADSDLHKFFACLNDEEMHLLHERSRIYNSHNKKTTTPEKILGILIAELRQSPNHRLPCAPTPISNNPNTPCLRYFNLVALEKWGDRITQRTGSRPPTPSWDQFFCRIRNKDMIPYVKAYFAGLFIERNRTKQALYIFGNGDDGKTQVTNALSEALGNKIKFFLPQNMKSDQFTMSTAWGKRVFFGEEMQNPEIIKKGMLHTITGGSETAINIKFEKTFSGRIYCCGVITSNYAPILRDVKNQISRILYIEVDPPEETDVLSTGLKWGEDLKKETNAMLYEGMQLFKQLNETGSGFKMLQAYREVLEELFDEKSRYIDDYIESVFEYNPVSRIRNRLHKGFLKYLKDNIFESLGERVPFQFSDSCVAKELFEKLMQKFPTSKKIRLKNRLIDGIGLKKGFEAYEDIFLEDVN